MTLGCRSVEGKTAAKGVAARKQAADRKGSAAGYSGDTWSKDSALPRRSSANSVRCTAIVVSTPS